MFASGRARRVALALPYPHPRAEASERALKAVLSPARAGARGRTLPRKRDISGMRQALRVFIVILFIAGATSCTTQGCNDNYDPTDPDSCSYNPELTGYVEDRNAGGGLLPVPEDLGGGYVYLLVTPAEVPRGQTPRIALINASDVDVGYGQPFELVRGDGSEVKLSCLFTSELLHLPPEAESDAQRLDACLKKALPPDSYEISKGIQLDAGAERGKELTVTASFTVVRE